jgi:hypothetical protein
MKHDVFKPDFSNACENLLSRYDNLFILGDLNYDMLDKAKSSNLVDVCKRKKKWHFVAPLALLFPLRSPVGEKQT